MNRPPDSPDAAMSLPADEPPNAADQGVIVSVTEGALTGAKSTRGVHAALPSQLAGRRTARPAAPADTPPAAPRHRATADKYFACVDKGRIASVTLVGEFMRQAIARFHEQRHDE